MRIDDLRIESPAFGHGERIPDRHTAEGDDVSPELRISGVPEGTRQLAVICHDPDAPLPHGFTHWVLYGIPAGTTVIPEGGGSAHVEGQTDFGGKQGYGGPAPPPGHDTHFYYFFVYALDSEIPDGPGLTRHELLDRVGERLIEMNRVVGTYSR